MWSNITIEMVRCEKLLMEAIENNILRDALALGEFAAGDFDVAGANVSGA